jgi:hypothetical protein
VSGRARHDKGRPERRYWIRPRHTNHTSTTYVADTHQTFSSAIYPFPNGGGHDRNSVILKRKHLPPIRLEPSWPLWIDFFERSKIILRRVFFVRRCTLVLPTAGTATASTAAVHPSAGLGSWSVRWAIPTYLAVISYLSISTIPLITHSLVSAPHLVLIILPSQMVQETS